MIWDALYIFQDEKCRLMRNLSLSMRWTHKRRTSQRSDSTNVGLVQTSGLVRTSDWDKGRTCINVGPVQTSDGWKNVGLWLSLKKDHCYRK